MYSNYNQGSGQYNPSSFGQPGAPNYGQAGGPNYGQPSAPNYGQPGAPNLGQPNAPSFGQPDAPNYGHPGAQSFGQQGYNQPMPGAPQFGQPTPNAPMPGHHTSGGFPPHGVSPETQNWFNAVDADRSGKINAKELQAALVNGQGKNFDESVCKLMINLFDKDHSGTIDVHEFQSLYQYINNWINAFKNYDRDGSGCIEQQELKGCLEQMGFRFSSEFYKMVITKYDFENQRNITVDQFIGFCVQLQKFTEMFRSKDAQQNGSATFGFEDFINAVISCV